MPIHLLTEAQVEAATDGTLHDGHDHGELVLETRNGGKHKSYFYRYNARPWDGNRGERIGLGSAHRDKPGGISLDEAWRKAGAIRNLIKRGVNPKTYREGIKQREKRRAEKQPANARTLGQALDEYFKYAKDERLWKSPNTIDTNMSCKKSHLDMSGYMNRPLQSMKIGYVADLLLSIKRKGRHGMFTRAHSLLNCMFEWEIGHERYVGINPAGYGRFHPLTKLLGSKPAGKHRPAVPYQNLPDVIAYIRTPKRDPDTWLTVNEAAAATGRDLQAIRIAYKRGHIDKSKMKRHPIRKREWLIPIETDASGTQTLAGDKELPIINKPVAIEREDDQLYTDILQVLMFTGARSEMICEMKWGQIKWEEGVIEYLPETDERESEHKTGGDGDPDNIYTIILTENVREKLLRRKQLREDNKLTCNDDDYVFTHLRSRMGRNKKLNHPPNESTINQTLQRIVERIDDILDKECTVHGLRNGFSDWVVNVYKAKLDDVIAIADTTLMDAALGHQIKVFRDNKSNKAYVRSPQFKDRRRALMTEWERYLLSKCPKPEAEKVAETAEVAESDNILPLRRSTS
jgi:integrase